MSLSKRTLAGFKLNLEVNLLPVDNVTTLKVLENLYHLNKIVSNLDLSQDFSTSYNFLKGLQINYNILHFHSFT
jgi:hypothetical protein